MITVKNIFDYLNQKYPIDTAREFDNPGLLVGDGNQQVKKALVCLDCDINAVNRAKEIGANLIVTHHPVIFGGLKSVTAGSVVYELIKSGISVISMHTNLDIAVGGVTERLCEAIGLQDVTPFIAHDGFTIRSATCNITDCDILAEHIKKVLGGSVRYVNSNKPIKRVLVCSGSGGDFLEDVISENFDALIAGDIKHNVFISAINSGVSVFDAGHYQSENIIVCPLCEELSKAFCEIEFVIFNNDTIKSV